MRTRIENVKPKDIEAKSFEIITKELNGRTFENNTELIVKRCIHTSADFDYADNLCFSENVVEKAMEAIRGGASIVTDTNMAKAGINKVSLGNYGGQVYCFMGDEDVAAAAKESGMTRASESMKKAAAMGERFIYAIGNAPTALISLYEMLQKGEWKPAFIIGVPVGFVNVEAAKELILETKIPHIINRGRKGGSNVAAAICNALLYGLSFGF